MSKKRTKDLHVNRKYKDSLFRMIFSDKKDLLELYNAVNGSHYDNPEDLTLYTLEDAIYISYKNDISFLFGDTLNLYEHQSTINPNMPLRGLLYLVRNYEAYIEQHHLDIYSSIQQTVPLPQYIIFYNGTAEVPEQQILSLSDAFPKHPGKVSCLQFDAILLNINPAALPKAPGIYRLYPHHPFSSKNRNDSGKRCFNGHYRMYCPAHSRRFSDKASRGGQIYGIIIL